MNNIIFLYNCLVSIMYLFMTRGKLGKIYLVNGIINICVWRNSTLLLRLCYIYICMHQKIIKSVPGREKQHALVFYKYAPRVASMSRLLHNLHFCRTYYAFHNFFRCATFHLNHDVL